MATIDFKIKYVIKTTKVEFNYYFYLADKIKPDVFRYDDTLYLINSRNFERIDTEINGF